MFEVVVGTILTIVGTALLAVIAWAFKISNKVAVLEADKNSLKEFIKQIFDELTRRLDRIDRKLESNEDYNNGIQNRN
jgi:hypothetical protein